MTALGQSRPNWAVRVTSGLPPVATVERTSRFGSFVPTADSNRGLAQGTASDSVSPLYHSPSARLSLGESRSASPSEC
jgi:hypothetical protein